MRTPEFITFTGIDDRTDLERADKLASVFPIEWGVLLSATNRDAKFPSQQAVNEILDIKGAKSAHLCGDISRNFQSGFLPEHVDLSRFDRVQVNGIDIDYGCFDDHSDDLGVSIITQLRGTTFSTLDPMKHWVYELYDCSGGKGLLPATMPQIPSINEMVGFAGGMGPETVLDYLSKIEGDGQFWIDMEGRVRTNGFFDLDKVESVCQLVFP
jgi:hypothetical protein